MPHNHAAVCCVTGGHEKALDVLRRHAGAVSAAIVERSPAGAVTAVFAGGSLAAGRVAWFDAGELEIYSDIDLYVVAADEHLDAVDAAVRAAVELDAPAGVRFLRGVDVGVYTRADLESQPARPGTVGLRTRRVLFHGDDGEVAAMTSRITGTVAPDEGLYLMENRVGELEMDGELGGPEGRRRRYEHVKTALDSIMALEIITGRYEGTLGGRRQAFEALTAAGDVPDDMDRGAVEVAIAASENLHDYLGDEARAISAEGALMLALSVWRFGATRRFPDASADWATLTLRRCKAGAYSDNLREFLAMAAGRGRTRLRMAWTAAALSRYSAVTALRLGALVDAVLTRGLVDDIGCRSLDGFRAYLDRLTVLFGFEDGCLAERVAAMHRAVSGG